MNTTQNNNAIQFHSFMNEATGVPARFFLYQGNPAVIANEFAACLGIKNARDALASIPDNEKTTMTIDVDGFLCDVGTDDVTYQFGEGPGRQGQRRTQTVNILLEPGIYRLALRSRIPAAEAFKTTLVNEILPTLRRTGTYSVPGVRGPGLEGLEQLTDVVERLASAMGPVVETMERLVTASTPVVGGRETWPDKYNAPTLTINEIVTGLGPEGQTRARYRAEMMVARKVGSTVVDNMIDVAIYRGLIDENTDGARIFLEATRAAWSLHAKELQAQRMLAAEIAVLEGREDGR